MIERGFSKPTQRVERLRKVIINATPEVVRPLCEVSLQRSPF